MDKPRQDFTPQIAAAKRQADEAVDATALNHAFMHMASTAEAMLAEIRRLALQVDLATGALKELCDEENVAAVSKAASRFGSAGASVAYVQVQILARQTLAAMDAVDGEAR